MNAVVLRKTERRRALETPHADQHTASLERRADRGRMPKSLGALLTWFANEWQAEVPDRIHKADVWVGGQERDRRTGEARWPKELVGGSQLGTPRHADPFRRYMENYASETDQDGYFLRPCHAALGRLSRRDVWMGRNLFALAQAGFEWKAVADRGSWVHEMYAVYIEEALRRLWLEHSDVGVRLQ